MTSCQSVRAAAGARCSCRWSLHPYRSMRRPISIKSRRLSSAGCRAEGPLRGLQSVAQRCLLHHWRLRLRTFERGLRSKRSRSPWANSQFIGRACRQVGAVETTTVTPSSARQPAGRAHANGPNCSACFLSHYLIRDRYGRPGKSNQTTFIGVEGHGACQKLVATSWRPFSMHVNMHCRAVGSRQFPSWAGVQPLARGGPMPHADSRKPFASVTAETVSRSKAAAGS